MLSNDEKQRIYRLESDIARLESLFIATFNSHITTGHNALIACQKCGMVPYGSFVCGNEDCAIGKNPADDCVHDRAKQIVNIHQQIIDKTT